MRWKESDPDIRSRNVRELTQQISVVDALVLLLGADSIPFVIVDKAANQKIESHLSSKNVELGGLLRGCVYSTIDLALGVKAIQITDAIACENFSSTGVSLSMSSEVWQKANSNSSEEIFVVGWYHSHPNLGAFFSGTDRKTQKAFFSNPYSLGLVVDPIRKKRKWFLGKGSIEVPDSHALEFQDGLAMV